MADLGENKMINKEAIEKLEAAIAEYDGPMIKFYYAGRNVKYYVAEQKLFDQALALLKEQPPEPKCKICSDKKPEGYIKWLIGVKEEDKALGHNNIQRTLNQEQELYKMYLESFYPCPACKAEQPPASEFTTKIRKRWLAEAQHQDSTLDYAICAVIDLCDRLDASEAENKKLRRPMECAGFDIDGMITVGAELIKRDKRIKDIEASCKELVTACEKLMKAWLPTETRSMRQLDTDMNLAYQAAVVAIAKANKQGKSGRREARK